MHQGSLRALLIERLSSCNWLKFCPLISASAILPEGEKGLFCFWASYLTSFETSRMVFIIVVIICLSNDDPCHDSSFLQLWFSPTRFFEYVRTVWTTSWVRSKPHDHYASFIIKRKRNKKRQSIRAVTSMTSRNGSPERQGLSAACDQIPSPLPDLLTAQHSGFPKKFFQTNVRWFFFACILVSHCEVTRLNIEVQGNRVIFAAINTDTGLGPVRPHLYIRRRFAPWLSFFLSFSLQTSNRSCIVKVSQVLPIPKFSPSRTANSVMPSATQVTLLHSEAKPGRLSDAFHRLVEALSNELGPSSGLDSADVDPKRLQRLMQGYLSKESEWQRYAFKDASHTFARNLVDEGNGKSNLVRTLWVAWENFSRSVK